MERLRLGYCPPFLAVYHIQNEFVDFDEIWLETYAVKVLR